MSTRDPNLLVPSQPPRGRKLRHSHPGEILQNLVMEDIDWSVSEMARRLGIPRQQLQGILAAKRPVTPEVAVRLGALFGNSGRLWLSLQVAYDMAQAKKDLQGKLRLTIAAGKRLAAQTNVEYRQAA